MFANVLCTKDDKVLDKTWFELKGHNAVQFISEFPIRAGETYHQHVVAKAGEH